MWGWVESRTAQPMVDYGCGASVTVSALYLLPGALVMLPAGPFALGISSRRGAPQEVPATSPG